DPLRSGTRQSSATLSTDDPLRSGTRQSSGISSTDDSPSGDLGDERWSSPCSVWVAVAGLLAAILGIKAAIWHQDHLWGAGAIVLASVAGAVVAVARRREGWAFTAGLGID